MYFFVKQIDESGNEKRAIIEASSIDDLFTKAQNENKVLLDIKEVPAYFNWTLGNFIKKRVSKEEVIELLKNLYTIVKSGVPLYDGIKDMALDVQNKDLAYVMKDIASNISTGTSLSKAMRKYEYIFTPLIIGLIVIGEKTGELEETLKRGAEFLEKIENLKKKATQALIYPSFAITAIIVAMLVWMIYVLPQIIALFQSMNIVMPPITLAFISSSDYLQKYGLEVLSVFVGIFILIRYAVKHSYIARYNFHKLLLKIPIISSLQKNFNIAFICEYLRLSINSGLPIFDAMHVLQNNIQNEVYKKNIAEAILKIEKGEQLSLALKDTNLYSPFSIRMLSVGEQTGDIDRQLKEISSYHYEKVDYMAENITKIIEPALMVIVGAFMGTIMLALLGPIYDLIGQVG
ncbi:type II secretion system F family protein [Arcobacter sp. FWKO B]|uniref:type II secretion system F family protein n=1 Tax=Arcobacter sp. FWKO B TaxID=2593672 RepID=UPI0018A4A763|nr:type II secretion system F family protein [Arcobacter sp. FWKO B]QOG11629.1 type II secretion system F family protein [Arcobacter sp. FWKO B]